MQVAKMATVCTRRPELCRPRKVDMVLLDADDTMWEIKPYGIASSVRGPFKKIDDDTLEAEEGGYFYEPTPPAPPTKPITTTLRSVPEVGPLHLQEEELEEWWKTKAGPIKSEEEEEEEKLEDIAKELKESLSEKQRRLLEAMGKAKGEQLELIEVEKPKKRRWWEEFGRPKEKPEEKPPAPTYRRKVTIKLLPTLRDTLNRLNERNIPVGVISLNTPGSVKRIIDAFGLSDKFVEVKDSWENKGKVFQDITKKHHINPCNTIFVDNVSGHVEDVAEKCSLGLVIGKGGDIEVPAELLHYIEEKTGG